MKRFLSLTIALLIVSGTFAQQDFTCELNAQKSIDIPVTLMGPQAVQLSLAVNYQPDKQLILLKMSANYRREYVKQKKNQYTHLWFPMTLGEVQYKDLNSAFMSHFKQRYYDSRVVLGTQIRDQINSKPTDFIRPALQCTNGDLGNRAKEDIMFSLEENNVVELMISVSNIDEPVILKMYNVIPLRYQFDNFLQSNKYYLKYISDSITITFNLPEDDCAGQHAIIEKYKELNQNMKSDMGQLGTLLKKNSNNKEVARKQVELFYKYKNDLYGINDATTCDNLLKEFGVFRKNFETMCKGIITPDSLQQIFNELDTIFCRAGEESNRYHRQNCKDWKKKAEKYNDLELDEEVYSVYPGAKDTVDMIKNRITQINGIVCRGSGGNGVSVKPTPTPTPTPTKKVKCQFDEDRMLKVLRDINRLWTANLKGEKNKNEFDKIKRETDNYLNGLSESCKENNKEVIESYRNAVKTYLNEYK